MQDPIGDGDDATSDALFVFTGTAPDVAVGDSVSINGTVGEFTPGGASSNNLSTTQITGPIITVESQGNALPAATIIGNGGRQAPTQSIDSDNFANFNPETDGIDFFESLEGMRVTLSDAQAVATTNQFGEIFAVADQGANATGMNAQGGITISEGDFNPERLQIDDTLLAGNSPAVQMGDKLGDVTGVIAFNFGNFELLATEAPEVTAGSIAPETASIAVGGDRLSVATYNVLNLDPSDGPEKFAGLARQIVDGLLSPDIIGLQEIQDGSGPTNDGTTSAALTLQMLIDAIVEAGGPRFEFAEIAPVNNTSGGEPGANIRTAFLYNPDRVDLVPGSLMILPGSDSDPAFDNARKPLVATFVFNGHEVTIVNNHFTSKGGSSPLFGTVQPSINGGEDKRVAQATMVNNFIQSLLSDNPTANIIALGDLNEFQFMAPLLALTGLTANQILFNLAQLQLSPEDLFSFIFEGNAQLLDHILISSQLLQHNPLIDIVHLNSGLLEFFSDHDPILASFLLPQLVDIPTVSSLLLFLVGFFLLVALSRKRSLALRS
jgi:predicted extracellular nuclease